MKTSHVSVLAVIALSLALCACDNGDKKETGSTAPNLPPKKTKEAGVPADVGSPPAPEPSAPAGAPPPLPTGAAAAFGMGSAVMPDLDKINGAIKLYNQRRSVELMTKVGPTTGGDLNAQKQKYLANAGKNKSAGTSTGLTSLEDLVKAGLLKSIPEAPAGKKFVFDARTQEARLDNK